MERKIKIVRIINRFNIGGPTFNATYLTRYLPEEYETLLVGGVPDEGEKDSLHILKEHGIEPIIVPELSRSIHPLKDRKAYRKVKRIIKQYKPDIVHTHASKAGLIGRLAAKRLKVPVIVHTFHGHVFHSYFGRSKTDFFKRIERYLAKISTGIIAISYIQKKELTEEHKIVAKEKVTVIPLGFELQKFVENFAQRRKATREEYKISDDEVAIAIVGRLAPIKDHDFFLDCVERLLKKTEKKIRVFIVGDGSERSHIEEKVLRIDPEGKRIHLTSWILDISTFNAGMDIVCLTSKNEGTPVSLIEAQATGVPVISSDVGGVRDIVVDRSAGFIIKQGDFETYTEKLRLLVEDDELRKKFGEFGSKYVLKRYGYEHLVENTDSFYKVLLRHEK
jgi:glycosyltransferase involved in cell wall biosynthesis